MSLKPHGITRSGDQFKTQINRRGKVFYLGTYDDQNVAARVVDMAVRITEAWGAVHRYNYGRPDTVEAEEQWNPFFKPMIEWLRTHFPEDERARKRMDAAAEYLPDVVLESFDHALIKLKTVMATVSEVLEDGRQALQRASVKAAEDQQVIAWQREKIAEFEQRAAGKKYLEEMVARQGGVLFKRIIPGQPDQPVKIDAVPAPATDVPEVVEHEVPITPQEAAVVTPEVPVAPQEVETKIDDPVARAKAEVIAALS